jgi:hypothetical protein
MQHTTHPPAHAFTAQVIRSATAPHSAAYWDMIDLVAWLVILLIIATACRLAWLVLGWIWRPRRVHLVSSELYQRSHHAAGTDAGQPATAHRGGFLGLK